MHTLTHFGLKDDRFEAVHQQCSSPTCMSLDDGGRLFSFQSLTKKIDSTRNYIGALELALHPQIEGSQNSTSGLLLGNLIQVTLLEKPYCYTIYIYPSR